MSNFKEAKETFGQMLRWTKEPKDQKEGEKTIYLGDIVTGYYVGKKEDVGPNESQVYELKLADGQLVSFWGSDLLDGKFAEIPQGCEVRVTFLGIAQPKTPKGRAYRNFRVEYDKDSRMPLNTVAGPEEKPLETAPESVPTQAPLGSKERADQDFDSAGRKDAPAGEGF